MKTNPLPQSTITFDIYLKCEKIHIKIFVYMAQKQRKNIFLYLIYRVMKQTNSETYRLNRLSMIYKLTRPEV